MVNLDNIEPVKILGGFFGGLLVLLILYYFYKMMKGLIGSYSFKSFGGQFDKSFLSLNDFGLKGTDRMDFKINIRTDDAQDDCNMIGRYKGGKIEKISIEGDGEKCENLRSNNKL
jgi:hypothetical protein